MYGALCACTMRTTSKADTRLRIFLKSSGSSWQLRQQNRLPLFLAKGNSPVLPMPFFHENLAGRWIPPFEGCSRAVLAIWCRDGSRIESLCVDGPSCGFVRSCGSNSSGISHPGGPRASQISQTCRSIDVPGQGTTRTVRRHHLSRSCQSPTLALLESRKVWHGTMG